MDWDTEVICGLAIADEPKNCCFAICGPSEIDHCPFWIKATFLVGDRRRHQLNNKQNGKQIASTFSYLNANISSLFARTQLAFYATSVQKPSNVRLRSPRKLFSCEMRWEKLNHQNDFYTWNSNYTDIVEFLAKKTGISSCYLCEMKGKICLTKRGMTFTDYSFCYFYGSK